MDKPLVRGGAIGTVLYFIGWATYVIFRWDDLAALRPNELGDFFAGTVGPVATLWLVLGFFQQRLELHQNTEALHIQANELRASVEQQRALVSVAREDHEANRYAYELQRQHNEEQRDVARKAGAPRLFAHFGRASSDGSRANWYFALHNGGAPCTDLELRLKTASALEMFSRSSVPFLGTSATADISLRMSPIEPATAIVEVTFVDSLENTGSVSFQVEIVNATTATIAPMK